MYNPPHPGEVLKEDYLMPLNLTVGRLSQALYVSRKHVSSILNGHSGISPIMAFKLAKAFHATPEFWMNLQEQYDLYIASQLVNNDEIEELYAKAA